MEGVSNPSGGLEYRELVNKVKKEWKEVRDSFVNTTFGLSMGRNTLPSDSVIARFIIEPFERPFRDSTSLGFVVKPIFKDKELDSLFYRFNDYMFKHEIPSRGYKNLNKRIDLFKRFSRWSLRGGFGRLNVEQVLNIIDQLQRHLDVYKVGSEPIMNPTITMVVRPSNVELWDKILGPKVD